MPAILVGTPLLAALVGCAEPGLGGPTAVGVATAPEGSEVAEFERVLADEGWEALVDGDGTVAVGGGTGRISFVAEPQPVRVAVATARKAV